MMLIVINVLIIVFFKIPTKAMRGPGCILEFCDVFISLNGNDVNEHYFIYRISFLVENILKAFWYKIFS